MYFQCNSWKNEVYAHKLYELCIMYARGAIESDVHVEVQATSLFNIGHQLATLTALYLYVTLSTRVKR